MNTHSIFLAGYPQNCRHDNINGSPASIHSENNALDDDTLAGVTYNFQHFCGFPHNSIFLQTQAVLEHMPISRVLLLYVMQLPRNVFSMTMVEVSQRPFAIHRKYILAKRFIFIMTLIDFFRLADQSMSLVLI